MENANVKIRNISLKSYKCFEEVTLNCAKKDNSIYQWTVLLGNNNTGKTSILKAIANLRPVSFKGIKPSNTEDVSSDTTLDRAVSAGYLDRDFIADFKQDSFAGCATTDDKLDSWFYRKDVATSSDASITNTFCIYGYGVSRYPSKTNLSDSICSDCSSLFSQDQRLINIEEWLMQMDYSAKSNNPLAGGRLAKIRELLCSNLFPEILDFKFESSDTLHNFTLFLTKDGWFRYTELGYGYQSMLSWVVDLCKRMFERYPNSEHPLEENAIVLVDEIDLHLHPKWQRDIISFLSRAFPNIQFIVTTHSPLVIQSMNEVNLYVLHRQGDKVVVEHSDYTNFKGWTVEEILRDVMRLESDIYSDDYQKQMKLFDEGLDENDKAKARLAYHTLSKMLHPQNPVKRLLELQFSQLADND